MVMYLSKYCGEYYIFSISRDKEKAKRLIAKGLRVGLITANALVILPEGIQVLLTEKEMRKIDVLQDGDVCDINANGILYRWYSIIEGDAGVATTPKCNSNCIMCPASDTERRQKNDMTIQKIDTVIKHMPKNLWYFTITGGEPTLIGEENFVHVLCTVRKELPNTKILLLTNGRTLGDKKFFYSFIKAAPKHIQVAIPIHGSTAQKHDYIIRDIGGFEQTIRGISNLLKHNIELEIRIVVSKLNMNDITDIAKLIVDMFPTTSVVNIIGLEMRGNCVVYPDKVLISYQDAFRASVEAIKLLASNGINVGLYNFPYCMIDENYWPIAQKSISAYKSKFYAECDACELRNECCGIFASTMNYYKPKVYPIKRGSTV